MLLEQETYSNRDNDQVAQVFQTGRPGECKRVTVPKYSRKLNKNGVKTVQLINEIHNIQSIHNSNSGMQELGPHKPTAPRPPPG